MISLIVNSKKHAVDVNPDAPLLYVSAAMGRRVRDLPLSPERIRSGSGWKGDKKNFTPIREKNRGFSR